LLHICFLCLFWVTALKIWGIDWYFASPVHLLY
jgi:hypothetical protein